MIFRVGRQGSRHAAPQALPAREFASEKQIKLRMRAIKGIQKISKAVYMVASAKLKRTEARLMLVRRFAHPLRDVWPTPETKSGTYLIMALASDRGLCGSFNSQVSRSVRNTLQERKDKGNTEPVVLVIFGEKVKVALERAFGNYFNTTISEFTKLKVGTFLNATKMWDQIRDVPFDYGHLVYNSFKNLMSYDTTWLPIANKQTWMKGYKPIQAWKQVGDINIKQNLYEWIQVIQLYLAYIESETSELSARMNAMQNASNNTRDLLGVLQLKYNKTRQAKVTKELCEIVAGASATEKKGQQW